MLFSSIEGHELRGTGVGLSVLTVDDVTEPGPDRSRISAEAIWSGEPLAL